MYTMLLANYTVLYYTALYSIVMYVIYILYSSLIYCISLYVLLYADTHKKVLTYIKYRAVSGVFRTIDQRWAK
jgi:hypothetical protein